MEGIKPFLASSIEQELGLKKWCSKNEIEMFLFDMDDTLCKTNCIFENKFEKCGDYLSDNVGILSREQWENEIKTINNEQFEKNSVNRKISILTIEQLGIKYGLNSYIQNRSKKILAETYKVHPKFTKGAEKGLDFLTKSGIRKGVVTHANREWSLEKFGWLGLNRFFDWENDVFIVDENGHKTKESWLEAMNYFKVKPENCVVIGDSPRADINPASSLGVRHCFLKNSNVVWSVHQQPVDEQKVRRIKSIYDLRFLGGEVVHQS